tara:strand:- start:260 stop:775 length:516 start_codon:yes stop_codon:yes gene_type:complete
MAKYDNLSSANTLAQHATLDRDRLVVHLFTEMSQKISYLEQQVNEFGQWRDNADQTALRLAQMEVRLDQSTLLLAQLRDGDGDQLLPFADRVLAVIEDSSYTAFTHIEAEIDEKLADFIDSYSFTEAVAEAASTSLSSKVEEILDGLLHDAIIDAIGDPEDIVRKGLRSIL